MNYCIPYKDLKPADACVICGRSHSEAGNMIVSQKMRGIRFSARPIGGGSAKIPYKSIPLNKNKNMYINFWGDDRFWSHTSIEKAIEMYYKNKLPWFCSYCGKRTCSICGKPLASPVGSDYLNKKGELLHAPILGVKIPCINPSCKKLTEKEFDYLENQF